MTNGNRVHMLFFKNRGEAIKESVVRESAELAVDEHALRMANQWQC